MKSVTFPPRFLANRHIMRYMASMPEPSVPALVELRQLRSSHLEHLLEEETAEWEARLCWDFRPSADLVQRFVTPQGKIFSRKRSGCCGKHQRELKMAVKYARFLALIPYVG